MLDLIHHRVDPRTETEWYYEYERTMGEQTFRAYINRVYGVLLDLPIGGSFSIEKRVKPANHALFVKIGCLFINEQNKENFEFNSRFTEIRRLKPCTNNGENISASSKKISIH